MRTGTVKALIVAGAALLSIPIVSGPVSADNHDPFTNGDQLTPFANPMNGNSLQGGHFDGYVNEHPPGEYFQIGGIGLLRFPDGCNEHECTEWHVGYCTEADAPLQDDYAPYFETTIDGRLSYLTWKYGYEFWETTHDSGNAVAPMVAVQALVWAWHSDPETGSSVFSSVAGGLDDPFNWDGLTPSLHTDPSPRVGFHGDDLGLTDWTGTDEQFLQAATQAVYDLAVESTAKAGPWTLSQGVGATGVVLTGSNGPIEGEKITFGDGMDNGVDVVTDADGFAAWPAGMTFAHAEGPGQSYETQGDSDQGEEGQNIVLTHGELLEVKVGDPAPTTTTPDPDEVVELPATGVENTSGFFTLILVSSVLGGGLALVALTRRNREAR